MGIDCYLVLLLRLVLLLLLVMKSLCNIMNEMKSFVSAGGPLAEQAPL